MTKPQFSLETDIDLIVDASTVRRGAGSALDISSRFAPVAADELAFAMAVFVSSANGQNPFRHTASPPLERSSARKCRKAFATLSAHQADPNSADRPEVAHETTLEAAFLQLWQHYHGDKRQTSICARVLGFYYIMEQTSGAAMDRWVLPCAENPDVVMLQGPVVQAIAEANRNFHPALRGLR